MQLLQDIRPYFIQKLSEIYGEKEANSMAYWSIEEVLGCSKSDCILHPNLEIDQQQQARLTEIVSRLESEEPIQHIFENCLFYGLSLAVNKHTLIPRPETEALVQWVLKENFNTLLDIGTGSGCIPVAIAKNTAATITALDISKSALEVARINAKKHRTAISFLQADILQSPALGRFDVITSNPPYVLESEKTLMRKNVLEHEPASALFVADDEALLFYDAIAEWAKLHLEHDGKLFFEINEHKGEEVVQMLQEKGFSELELKKDMEGKDRMVKAVWKM